jgi:hypothetical protein
MVDYKALIGLSLLRVPHFCARCGASLRILNPGTTSTSKAKYFRDYFRSSSEDMTRASTPDMASPALLLLNQNLYKQRTTGRVWCANFHHEGGFYMGEWDLHRLGEVGLVPGGGRAAKPCSRPGRWSGLHRLSPPTRTSPPHVDARQPRLRPDYHKPGPADQGVRPADRPLGQLDLGSGPLGPHVNYTPVVMMILTFGQLHFVIP